MRRIEEQLTQWHDTIPAFKTPDPFRSTQTIPCHSTFQNVIFHSLYNTAIFALERRLVEPIICERGGYAKLQARRKGTQEALREIDRRIGVFLDATRQSLQLTQHIHVDTSTPSCLAIHQPSAALVTLFAYVMANSLSRSAHDDIALIDIAAAYFQNMKLFLPAEAAFDAYAELSQLARQAVQNAELGNGFVQDAPENKTESGEMIKPPERQKDLDQSGAPAAEKSSNTLPSGLSLGDSEVYQDDAVDWTQWMVENGLASSSAVTRASNPTDAVGHLESHS
ncbi:uncharacterized protein Z520_00899 [Fonsecaea multimorphosa CBS 102226]|uniref:Uncharacterized protein n=1 Tax=Fonsecaea multimorphosa CBS 102226 TaxID=1442371 RepID=A0A0D2HQT1_9EURO|nr:uncharacterized protein Z520_00899 [Fonsecaea multimorphosa CBS 102226]KIY04206.1 hypothetical protein Z520_00899 [Fonsecaea multimorphosa CBS 102226]